MTNGEKTLLSLSDRLIRVLPPAFLGLLILNIVFTGSVMWLVTHGAEQRNALLTKIVESCLLERR